MSFASRLEPKQQLVVKNKTYVCKPCLEMMTRLVDCDVWQLPWPVISIPVNNHDTAKMGMVCHRYGISATIPIPIKPTINLPWVYLYL